MQVQLLIENLTMFPTSDLKTETTLPIAQSLSYNILKFGREWSKDNRDTGQITLSCRFMFWKKSPPIDITRKYEKLCIVALIKIKNKCHISCRELFQLQHIKIWEITNKGENLNWTKKKMTSSMKITFFEFRCQYDDVTHPIGQKSCMYSHFLLIGFQKKLLPLTLHVKYLLRNNF